MYTQVKDITLNTNHISMLAVKDTTLVVDFAYSKPEGPVFLVFDYTTQEDAQAELDRLTAIHNTSK